VSYWPADSTTDEVRVHHKFEDCKAIGKDISTSALLGADEVIE
jgi:hypothetical protein